MKLVIFAVLLCSHSLAAALVWRKISQRRMPSTSDFAFISVFLYYDVGLVLEIFWASDTSPYLEANNTTLLAIFIIASAPWLFRLGSTFVVHLLKGQKRIVATQLRKKNRFIFYISCIIICVILVLESYKPVILGESIWLARISAGIQWGALIIIFYFPLHLLSFYIVQRDSQKSKGIIFSIFLLIVSILTTIQIGQRTTLILPVLIFVIFRSKISFSRLFIAATVVLLIASALLPIFKWQYTDQHLPMSDLVLRVIQGDVSRTAILQKTLELSRSAETEIMPYPMAGYVYSLLFLVPRNLAPFKGYSTATYFTSSIVGSRVDETSWGYGLGAIEELLLNAGQFLLVPGLLLYGLIMGLLDRLSQRIPSCVVPTRLSALWVCGYHLPAIFLLFGTMVITHILLNTFFAERISLIHARFGRPPIL